MTRPVWLTFQAKEILVAVFPVIFTFFLLVGGALTGDHAGVRGKYPNGGKATDVTGFHGDGPEEENGKGHGSRKSGRTLQFQIQEVISRLLLPVLALFIP